jgi:hypothetical protein
MDMVLEKIVVEQLIYDRPAGGNYDYIFHDLIRGEKYNGIGAGTKLLSKMALPRRCAASLRLAVNEPKRSQAVSDRQYWVEDPNRKSKKPSGKSETCRASECQRQFTSIL